MREYLWEETRIFDEDEAECLQKIFSEVIAYEAQNMQDDWVPYSYWTDNRGWLYMKWHKIGTDTKAVARYRFDKNDVLIAEKIKVNLSADQRLRGDEPDKPVVLITGDTHRNFKRIIQFCEKYPTTKADVIIILGDAGINYCNDKRDVYVKDRLSQLPITLFCIHGNHEMRPENIGSYHLTTWNGGLAYVESGYPNLIFAKDGEIYDIAGKKVMVIGGAYSVDKWYRLQKGAYWFENEQPSEETKRFVEKQLDKVNWSVDVVLSHTTPYQYMPVDLFLDFIDQSTVDSSTEEWLRTIEERLSYKKWYAGHYHCDRKVDNIQIMYRNVELFCEDRDLQFSIE